MKTLLYIFASLLLITSCTSVKKMVEKGDYDGAIQYAAKKLHGQKNKKTEHVQGLETAFRKVMEQDISRLYSLSPKNNPQNWARSYDILRQIERRQAKIAPFLPLVSKDGYAAHFKFIKTAERINEAADHASAYHYFRGKEMLSKASQTRKQYAKDAYYEFTKISKYNTYYKDVSDLMNEALEKGLQRVLVNLENNTRSILPRSFETDLLSINVDKLNSTWVDFDNYRSPRSDYDYIAKFEIERVDVSPEREKERIYIDRKDIADGFDYVLDQNGNVAKDSLGNDIKETRYVTVTAEVIELFREKSAIVNGKFRLIDNISGEIIQEHPMTAEAFFSNYASKFNGDRRALCDKTRKRLRSRPEAFPSDFDMISIAAEELKIDFTKQLDRIQLKT